MIYLDSAATSYHKPDGVARAVAEAISHMGNPGRGAHEASLDASRVVYGTREKMAELFGAEEDFICRIDIRKTVWILIFCDFICKFCIVCF